MRYFRFSIRSQPEIKAVSSFTDIIDAIPGRMIEPRKNTIEFLMNSNANQLLYTQGEEIPFLHHYIAVVFPDRGYDLRVFTEQWESGKSTGYRIVVEIPDLEYTWYDAEDRDSLAAFLQEEETEGSIVLPQIMRPDDRQYQKIAMYMRAIVNNCFKNSMAEKLRCLANWYELTALLDQYVRSETERVFSPKDTFRPTTDYYTHKAKKYINEHYSEHITVPIVAQQLGISPNYLSTIFKEGTGATVINYLNFYRVQKIREALCHDGQRNIEEICAKNGISDTRYARRLFKKYFGISIQRCLQLEHGITLPYNTEAQKDG